MSRSALPVCALIQHIVIHIKCELYFSNYEGLDECEYGTCGVQYTVKKHCITKTSCKNNRKVDNIQVFLMANTTERSPAMFDAIQVYLPKDTSLLSVMSRFGEV